jgi:hypothetical protein
MKRKKKVVEIVVPVPMPTWNRILSMTRFSRMKLRHLIHQLIWKSSITANGQPIPMVVPPKQQSMESLLLEYFQMIRPSGLNRSKLQSYKASLKKQFFGSRKSSDGKKRKA